MRAIFKGKHFKNGKIEQRGGSGRKVSLLLSFWRNCLPEEDFFLFTHFESVKSKIRKYRNVLGPIANISQINLIFTISEGRRLEERKAILRSYFSFYIILMFRKRNCIHSPMRFLLPHPIIRIMYYILTSALFAIKQRVTSAWEPVNNSRPWLRRYLAPAPVLDKYDRIWRETDRVIQSSYHHTERINNSFTYWQRPMLVFLAIFISHNQLLLLGSVGTSLGIPPE